MEWLRAGRSREDKKPQHHELPDSIHGVPLYYIID